MPLATLAFQGGSHNLHAPCCFVRAQGHSRRAAEHEHGLQRCGQARCARPHRGSALPGEHLNCTLARMLCCRVTIACMARAWLLRQSR